MTAEIFEFRPEFVGSGYRFDADKVLDAAKGQNFDRLVVIGQHEDGTLYVAGSANAGETVVLMEIAKRQIIFGE